MQIGELAAQSGLSRDTLRFYEKQGLLDGRRRTNGYRDFPPEALVWLEYVKTAQGLGFTLAEIRKHGAALRRAPDSARALSALLTQKLAVVDTRIAELRAMRRDLVRRIGTACPLR